MKTILAAVDSSNTSESVVVEAAELARTTNGRIVLLTIVQPPVITSEYAPALDNVAEITAASEKAAARHLEKLSAQLERDGIATETAQDIGVPVVQILEHARKKAADYIVMGSHGHTAFYDLLVGSTTHGVLLRAPCPVLIVPPKEKKKSRG